MRSCDPLIVEKIIWQDIAHVEIQLVQDIAFARNVPAYMGTYRMRGQSGSAGW